MWFKVEVNNEHIKNGVSSSPSNCPIALALKDLGLYNVRVNYIYATFATRDGGEEYAIRIPPAALRFMCAFDFEKNVEPFMFDASIKYRRR